MLDSYDSDIFSFLVDSNTVVGDYHQYGHNTSFTSSGVYAEVEHYEGYLVEEDLIQSDNAWDADLNRLLLTPQPTPPKANKKKRQAPAVSKESKAKRPKLRDHHHGHHGHHHGHHLPMMISPAAPLSVAGAVAVEHDQQSPAHLLQEQALARQHQAQTLAQPSALLPVKVEAIVQPSPIVVEDVAPLTPSKKRGPKTSAKNWSAQEEQLFEEGLTVYSLAPGASVVNWKQIADHVRTKTLAQIKAHVKAYLDATGGHLPHFSPERLAQLRQMMPPCLPPSKPGRKPKALLLQQSQVQAQQLRVQLHVQEMQQQLAASAAAAPAADKKPKRAGDVIVLCKIQTDEEEEVDIDYDSDHVSIDADGDDDDLSVSSTSFSSSSSSTVGFGRPSTPSLLDETSAHSASLSSHSSTVSSPMSPTGAIPSAPAALPLLSTAFSGPVHPSLVQFSANSLMMLNDAQLEWLTDLDLPPRQPLTLPADQVVDLEVRANAEFFEGNSAKTPERYLRIRNFIIKQWLDNPTQYVTKTSVRRNLPSCGDVNAMARVHQFLEVIGAINFNVAPPASCRKQGEAPLSPIAEGILRQQQLRARRQQFHPHAATTVGLPSLNPS